MSPDTLPAASRVWAVTACAPARKPSTALTGVPAVAEVTHAPPSSRYWMSFTSEAGGVKVKVPEKFPFPSGVPDHAPAGKALEATAVTPGFAVSTVKLCQADQVPFQVEPSYTAARHL